MEVLKDLETRKWIGGTGRKESAKFALFLCPNCKVGVELKLSKGKTQKSCGSAECRKAMFKYNLESGHSGAKTHGYSSHKYYSGFKEMYRLLKTRDDTALCSTWTYSLEAFVEDMFLQYVTAKDTGLSVTFTCNEDIATVHNSKWETVKDFKVVSDDMRLDTKTIADIVGTTHTIVKKTAIKVFGNTIERSRHTLVLHGKKRFPVEVYELTLEQFTELRNVVVYNSNKAISDIVYLMSSSNYVKIGITSNVDKRHQALVGSNPLPINIIFNKKIGRRARKLEAMLHRKYADQNLHHEWFTLTDEQVSECIDTIKQFKE